jgi:23S rRNA (adenine1618-N6)-methyltransferase
VAKSSPQSDPNLHPRNRHSGRYDFAALVRVRPELAGYVERNPLGEPTIDFANPAAVRALNAALLQQYYGVTDWNIPQGYLCPPVPGRADYIHHLADLIAEGRPAAAPDRGVVVVLDIGVGANCIYPIIGVAEYGWRFVGADIDAVALASAQRIVTANPGLAAHVELRRQPSAKSIFAGVVKPGETFTAAMCNPPFHESAAAASGATGRKLRNLSGGRRVAPVLNFGGQADELWCRGGEVAFVRRMIAESAEQPRLCRWFTTLVSKRESLPAIERTLAGARPADVRVIPMAQGQKKSRILAWRF